tara:strand:+ start:3441 stop:3842 length:402 start_codon:yes stop_codon:yes gene_type:complete
LKINKRYLAKSLTWRLVGTLDTFVFTWLITGNINEGVNLSIITTLTKLLWYYIHESLWFKSSIQNYNKRHLIKTFSWRFVGTLDTALFGWLITGNPITGAKISFFETLSKMILYYLHEKVWYRSNYGLNKTKF